MFQKYYSIILKIINFSQGFRFQLFPLNTQNKNFITQN